MRLSLVDSQRVGNSIRVTVEIDAEALEGFVRDEVRRQAREKLDRSWYLTERGLRDWLREIVRDRLNSVLSEVIKEPRASSHNATAFATAS